MGSHSPNVVAVYNGKKLCAKKTGFVSNEEKEVSSEAQGARVEETIKIQCGRFYFSLCAQRLRA